MRGLEVQVVTHPALPCLVLKTEGEELVVERVREEWEGFLVAIYQLCHTYPWTRQRTMSQPAGATVTSRTQLFQPTSAVMALLT